MTGHQLLITEVILGVIALWGLTGDVRCEGTFIPIPIPSGRIIVGAIAAGAFAVLAIVAGIVALISHVRFA